MRSGSPVSKLVFSTLLLMVISGETAGQYFQFSQSKFSEQRINPTYVAISDYASASFLYRQQTAAEDFNINSSLASLSLPFIRANGGQRWSGIGLTFLDDRSGQNGVFKVQEIGLSYAIRVRVARQQSVYFGVRGLYESRKFSLDGLYTGTQYIPGRGFNTSVGSGETPDDFRQEFLTFSTGLSWHATQRDGTRLAHAGIALFDINKVDRAFFSGESVAPVTAVLEGGLHLTGPTRLSLDPVALITIGQRTDINLGAVWNYELETGVISMITRYVTGRYGIAGIQYKKENLALGFSYDLPVHDQYGNRGSFEFGIKLKRLVKSRERRSKQENTIPDPPSPAPRPIRRVPVPAVSRKEPADYSPKLPDTAVKRVELLRNSESGKARAGDVIYYPYVNENSVLTFHFGFNSILLSNEARAYLEDIARLLNDNPTLRITITGHTDNIGSEAYNMQLSTKRAERIRDYLIAHGVSGDRIQARGRGESRPVDSNDSEEGRARNRRVEFRILR